MVQNGYTMIEYFTYCDTLSQLDFKSIYIWSMISKTITSFAALPLILYMVAMKKFLVYNEKNPLIYFKAAVLFMYALVMGLATGLQIMALFVSTNPCDRIAYTSTCVYFKAFNYANTFGISASMLALAMGTGLCLLLGNTYKTLKRWITAGILTIMILFYVLIVYTFYIIDSQKNFLHIHCIEDTPLTLPYARFFSMIQASMDAVTIALSIFLLLYCNRRLRSDRRDLNRTFSIRQSFTLLSAFFPLTIYHGITLVLYNTAHGVIRFQPNIDLITQKNWIALTNVLPYYALGAPIILTTVLAKIKKRRKHEMNRNIRRSFNGKVVPETNLYFEMLRKTWSAEEVNGPGTAKEKSIRK